jgi:hypothetical protein
VRDAVAGYDWRRMHPDLEIGVSCVRTGSEPDDTLDSWLHRCELAMYIEKTTRHDKIS